MCRRLFALVWATGEGHCGLPIDQLITLRSNLSRAPARLIELPLASKPEAGEVVAGTLDGRRCMFLAGLRRTEQVIVERLQSLGREPLPG